jgi:ribosomal protein S18 acetylase RimI-like enzyme
MNEMREGLSVKVRSAELKDLDFCIKSDFQHVDAYRGRKFMEKYLRRKIEDKNVILAEADGKPVGYLRIEYLGLTVPYLAIIGVNEKHQRKGIGTAMINFLEEYLLRHKGHKVFTCDGNAFLYSSAEATATESQAWHRALGFKECGIIAGCNDGGIGEIFFRKILKKSEV